jgi:Na+/pantothenate symporter
MSSLFLTTANSGFIVTGAAGLGYTYGLQWILLPLSWLLGDLLVFPARINDLGRESQATTLFGGRGSVRPGNPHSPRRIYIRAMVGRAKVPRRAFALPGWVALGLFALLIIAYSSIGGFRGSVYTDALQAVIRIVGTIVALAAVIWFAVADSATYWRNMTSAGDGFLNPFPGGVGITAGFVAGFAAAAIGFGLGQPQIVSRYLAGSSPKETNEACSDSLVRLLSDEDTWNNYLGEINNVVMLGGGGASKDLTIINNFFERNYEAPPSLCNCRYQPLYAGGCLAYC